MSEKQFKASFFQKLIDEETDKRDHRYASFYGELVKGQSPNDKIVSSVQDFYIACSAPFKKLEIATLNEQAKNCYPEKWMSESFSNAEQVTICKQEVHDKYFGKIEDEQNKWRDSSRFKYQDCEKAAGNNVLSFVHCMRDYQADVKADNERLMTFMKDNYAKYM